MKKKVIICVSVVCIAILVVGILFATHVLCIHKWNDATCIQPKNVLYAIESKENRWGTPLANGLLLRSRHVQN